MHFRTRIRQSKWYGNTISVAALVANRTGRQTALTEACAEAAAVIRTSALRTYHYTEACMAQIRYARLMAPMTTVVCRQTTLLFSGAFKRIFTPNIAAFSTLKWAWHAVSLIMFFAFSSCSNILGRFSLRQRCRKKMLLQLGELSLLGNERAAIDAATSGCLQNARPTHCMLCLCCNFTTESQIK